MDITSARPSPLRGFHNCVTPVSGIKDPSLPVALSQPGSTPLTAISLWAIVDLSICRTLMVFQTSCDHVLQRSCRARVHFVPFVSEPQRHWPSIRVMSRSLSTEPTECTSQSRKTHTRCILTELDLTGAENWPRFDSTTFFGYVLALRPHLVSQELPCFCTW